VLAVVYTLSNFGPDKRALCDNPLEGYHVVEMDRAEGSRIAGKLAKTPDKGAVVDL
jgi:hypothetical protein